MNNIVFDDFSKDDIVINLNENESLTYFNLNTNSKNIIINLKENSTLNYFEIDLNKSQDINLEVNLNGNNANFKGEVLTILKDNKIAYIQNINHNNPYTTSKIINFGITLDNSSILYKTIGKIKKRMVKSNCNQTSRGVIIGSNSKISSEPILLIDEFDVFANHGAAIGKMSDDELFYLMSRGLSKKDALMLIISGLINPIIDNLDEEHKNVYQNKINEIIEG